ncbi:MAG: DUF4386 domain-containing protein [Clostridia bacterium]|nr:DUF4386 domain-containing protein [Clostridia bacterium]
MKINRKQAALVTGISLILMTLFAFFAFGYAHNTFNLDTATASYHAFIENKSLFTMEITVWWFIAILDILVAFGFYFYFKKDNATLSLIALVFRILYTLLLSLGIFSLMKASQETTAEKFYDAFMNFEKWWSLGLIVFGVHLFFIGLTSKSATFVPRIFVYLFLIAGLSYSGIHGMNALSISYPSFIESILSVPMMFSEVAFSIFLLTKKAWKTEKVA